MKHKIEIDLFQSSREELSSSFINELQLLLEERVKHYLFIFDDLLQVPMHVCFLLIQPANELHWAAFYDARLSSSHFVRINYNLNVFRRFWTENKAVFEDQVDRTVLHELIHALDQQVITETNAVYRKRHLKVLDVQERSEAFWPILNYFSILRNEGIATFSEDLLINANVQFDNLSWEKSFISDLKDYMRLHDPQVDRSVRHVQNQLHELNRRAYRHGADLIAKMSIDSIGEVSNAQLIGEFLMMDLSEWIFLLLTQTSIEIQEVITEAFQAYDRRNRNVSLLSLLRITNSDQHFFKNELSKYCERRYTILELEGKLTDHFDAFTVYDLSYTIHKMALELLHHKNEESVELIELALNYLMQDDDLLFDSTSFIGLIDDWFVINGAGKFIGR